MKKKNTYRESSTTGISAKPFNSIISTFLITVCQFSNLYTAGDEAEVQQARHLVCATQRGGKPRGSGTCPSTLTSVLATTVVLTDEDRRHYPLSLWLYFEQVHLRHTSSPHRVRLESYSMRAHKQPREQKPLGKLNLQIVTLRSL